MAEWSVQQRTVLTKDVSWVSVLAVLTSVELKTQRVKRRREGEGVEREYPWASTMHVLRDQKHDLSGERTIKTRHIISPWERAGSLSVDIPQSTDCTKSTELRPPT